MIKLKNNVAQPPIFKQGAEYEEAAELIDNYFNYFFKQLEDKNKLTLNNILEVREIIHGYKNNNTEYKKLLSNLSVSCDFYADSGYNSEQYLYVKKAYNTVKHLPDFYIDKLKRLTEKYNLI